MAVKVKGSRGQDVTLLNPSEKGEKFADELRNNVRYTNDGKYKADKNGNVFPLTDTQRAFRSGYLTAQKDSARCYKARKKKTVKRK